MASGVGADALLIGKLCSAVVWGLHDSGGRTGRLWASVASASPALGFAITAIARSTLF